MDFNSPKKNILDNKETKKRLINRIISIFLLLISLILIIWLSYRNMILKKCINISLFWLILLIVFIDGYIISVIYNKK